MSGVGCAGVHVRGSVYRGNFVFPGLGIGPERADGFSGLSLRLLGAGEEHLLPETEATRHPGHAYVDLSETARGLGADPEHISQGRGSTRGRSTCQILRYLRWTKGAQIFILSRRVHYTREKWIQIDRILVFFLDLDLDVLSGS